MDYKKKYEESLERGSRLWESGSITLEDYEYMFPEHKESEDEKIRKEIISFLKEGNPYYCPNSVRRQEWATWLEKQDKNEEINEASYRTGIKRVLDNPESYGLEKQGEQKPGEDTCKISDCVEKVDMTEYNNGYECGKQRVLKYPEDYGLCKKPAWSEEDNIEISVLINALGELETYGGDFSKQKNWLKSIKERVRPQSKQEWSEEDEEMFDAIIADIQFTQKAHTHEVNQVVYEREIDWLKSIKERYYWKPSDEQIEVLLKLEEMHVLEHEKNQENAHLYMVIKSIREQLLKLKEK